MYYKFGPFLDTPTGRLYQVRPATELDPIDWDMADWVGPGETLITYDGLLVCCTAVPSGAVALDVNEIPY